MFSLPVPRLHQHADAAAGSRRAVVAEPDDRCRPTRALSARLRSRQPVRHLRAGPGAEDRYRDGYGGVTWAAVTLPRLFTEGALC
jgi:hypothetical protein